MTHSTLAALAAALFIAACGTQIYDVQFLAGEYGDSERSAFRYAGADRDFETVIIGNPFDVPKLVTDRAVIDAMQGRDKGMNTRFSTAPRNPYRPFRIVMAFNPDPANGIRALCHDPAAVGSGAGGDRLVLAAAFCYGRKLEFSVGSSMPAMASPHDPGFRRMVGRLLYHFVPYESMIDDEPDDDDDDS